MPWPKGKVGSFRGRKHSPESIEAIRLKLLGRPGKKCLPGCTCGKHSEEVRERARRNFESARKPCPLDCTCKKHTQPRCKPGCKCRRHLPEVRKEVGKARRGKTGTFLGHRHTEEALEAIRRGQALTYSKQGYLRTSIPQNKLFNFFWGICPEAQLNYQVEVSPGHYRYIDVALPSEHLAFEYDGEHWHQDKEREAKRDIELQNCGWRVVHVGCREVGELCRIL